MLFPKNLEILKASCREALYFPFSRDIMVCLVTPRAKASSSWVTLFCFLSSCILVFNHTTLSFRSNLIRSNRTLSSLIHSNFIHSNLKSSLLFPISISFGIVYFTFLV